MDKKEYRSEMKKKRKALLEAERSKKNEAIKTKIYELLSQEKYRDVIWIYPFVSYGTEVDTISLIKELLASDRYKVAVPKVEGDEMKFYHITSMKELTPGCMGILEPDSSDEKRVVADNGLMIMPGLVFDRNRGRIGYGGGYYDKYLALHKNEKLHTIAVAYDFQIIEESLDCDEYDIRPEIIVTDSQVIA